MLTESVLDTLQRATGLATFTAAVPNAGFTANKAANAQSFDQHAALARRSRRMRRAERNAFRSNGGWTVRMW